MNEKDLVCLTGSVIGDVPAHGAAMLSNPYNRTWPLGEFAIRPDPTLTPANFTLSNSKPELTIKVGLGCNVHVCFILSYR